MREKATVVSVGVPDLGCNELHHSIFEVRLSKLISVHP